MNKNILTIAIILVVGAGSFYGGMKYGQGNSRGGFQNLSAEERQQRFGNAGGTGMGGRTVGGNRTGGMPTAGEILSKDDKSITIKMRDGGSKIIFYSATTEISKFASGSASDIGIGSNVIINGTANQDGSLTAQIIQLRPTPKN